MIALNTFYDVQKLLQKFGIIIYFKDEKNTLAMMDEELKALHDAVLIDHQTFIQARLIINQRRMNKL